MTGWVARLLAANIIVFLLTAAAPQLQAELMFVPALALTKPWTFLTYMFLHAGIGHLLFNMIALFFFGPRLELELGSRHFLWLYFVSGITGALLSFFLSPYAAIVGASGAVYGIMLAYAVIWPRAQIYIWGVFPVEARWLVIGMTLLTLYGGFGGRADGVAHFAHLGGFVGGFVYLRWMQQSLRRQEAVHVSAAPTVNRSDLQRWMNIRREGLHEVNREELDRILEKLNATGPESLTLREREFLDRFSAA